MAIRLCTAKLKNTRKENVMVYIKAHFGHLPGCTTENHGKSQDSKPNIPT
jgi:hypothetical protein